MHSKLTLCLTLMWLELATAQVFAVEIEPLVKAICAVKAEGKGHREATAAWKKLSGASVDQIPAILAGMQQADALSENWLRAAVETIAQRQTRAGGKLPVDALEKFLADTKQSPRARRLAYELIAAVDPQAETRIIPTLTNDPSLELRRDAITLLLTQADKIDAKQNSAAAVTAYQTALRSARDLDQVIAAQTKLKTLQAPADLPRHFGLLMNWKLIGPFDNRNKAGFDVAYGPEKELLLNGSHAGKENQVVKWADHVTTDELGMVDLNKAIGKNMGAIAYAYTEFASGEDREVELRIGTPNGNKIWLNGQLLTANHVYHTGTQFDQYSARGRLKAGKNTILVKIAQNEQTDSWAQDWKFQLRVCDPIGTAILSQDRPASAPTSDKVTAN